MMGRPGTLRRDTMAQTMVRQQEQTRPKTRLVDCDIHNAPASPKTLLTYLNSRWHRRFEQYGMRPYQGSLYPRNNPQAARTDSWPRPGIGAGCLRIVARVERALIRAHPVLLEAPMPARVEVGQERFGGGRGVVDIAIDQARLRPCLLLLANHCLGHRIPPQRARSAHHTASPRGQRR